MKLFRGCMKLFISFLLSCAFLLNLSSVKAEGTSPAPTPITVPAVAYANKVIVHTFYLKEKVFALLDDSSLWEINPDYEQINGEHHDYLIGKNITLMPDISNADYEILFILDYTIDHFNVKLISLPSETSKIVDINLGELSLQYSLKEDSNKIAIMPSDYEILQSWQKGQKVVVGGVWFNEYDQAGISDCEYLYSLFNYEKKEFVRFKTFK